MWGIVVWVWCVDIVGGYCVGIVWVLCGYCVGIVWVLCGYCVGIVWVLCGVGMEAVGFRWRER